MAYKALKPPFTLTFREMSKEDLRDYFRWFMGVIPERTEELAKALGQTPKYGAWSLTTHQNRSTYLETGLRVKLKLGIGVKKSFTQSRVASPFRWMFRMRS